MGGRATPADGAAAKSERLNPMELQEEIEDHRGQPLRLLMLTQGP